jgi:hypothetical protein
MKDSRRYRYAGWSAIVSAAASIAGLVTLILLFSLGEPWGTINDISSVIQALSTLPVLLALDRTHRVAAPNMSLAAFLIGALGMLVAAVSQTLLIVRVIPFAQTAVISPVAFGVLGIPLIWYGSREYAGAMMPRRLALLSITTGVGFVVLLVGVVVGGQQNPLTAIGGLIAGILYPVWAFWFGRILLSGNSAV